MFEEQVIIPPWNRVENEPRLIWWLFHFFLWEVIFDENQITAEIRKVHPSNAPFHIVKISNESYLWLILNILKPILYFIILFNIDNLIGLHFWIFLLIYISNMLWRLGWIYLMDFFKVFSLARYSSRGSSLRASLSPTQISIWKTFLALANRLYWTWYSGSNPFTCEFKIKAGSILLEYAWIVLSS